MIHFTCDSCHRPIDPEHELRYVVRMEVYAALDATDADGESDRDHLEEIEDILARMADEADPEISEDVYRHARYDLCGECRQKFLRNPLGRRAAEFDFSNN
jgi:hypothetical protein